MKFVLGFAVGVIVTVVSAIFIAHAIDSADHA